jgi:hypothetical protein
MMIVFSTLSDTEDQTFRKKVIDPQMTSPMIQADAVDGMQRRGTAVVCAAAL